MGLAGIRWNFKEIPFTPYTTENNQRQERIALIFPQKFGTTRGGLYRDTDVC